MADKKTFMRAVMIAQWENECISLSILSVARVMIAQWENECISLSILSPTRDMIVPKLHVTPGIHS